MFSEEELDNIIKKHLIGGMINEYYFYKGTYLTNDCKNVLKEIEDFDVNDDDIFVTSFPKSGTTWTQQMVWLLANNLNYEVEQENILQRFPHIEMTAIFDLTELSHVKPMLADSIKYVREYERKPRCIKTHLPWHLLPRQIQTKTKRPRIIHVARNPKDVCVSYYYLYRNLFTDCKLTFDEFWKLFLAGKVLYGPYWSLVNSYWEQRNEPNVLFIYYEDMKKDLRSVVLKVAKFLDKQLNEDELKKLLEHLTFDSMLNNRSCNYDFALGIIFSEGHFIRKGIIGDHKNHMTTDIIKLFDEWIRTNDNKHIFT